MSTLILILSTLAVGTIGGWFCRKHFENEQRELDAKALANFIMKHGEDRDLIAEMKGEPTAFCDNYTRRVYRDSLPFKGLERVK